MSQLRTSSIQHPSSSSANIVLAADGSVEIGALNGFRYAGTRYFFGDGTFAKDDPLGTGDIGLRAVRVRVQGAGGGGGGCGAPGATQVAAGGGGGGGAYAESFILAASLSASEDVDVGLGGTGGAAGVNNGSVGGTSSFGTLVSADGGTFGFGRGPVPVTGISARSGISGLHTITATGDITVAGGPGEPVCTFPVTVDLMQSPSGGDSVLGNGGQGIVRASTQASLTGRVGRGFGGGASGGCAAAGQDAAAGGAGSSGVVIVDCYV